MKTIVTLSKLFIGLILLVLVSTHIAGATTDSVLDRVDRDSGFIPVVDTPLLDSLGLSTADQVSLTQKAKEISEQYKGSSESIEKSAVNAAGTYIEDSMEKITTADGTPFEGGTTIEYTISPDNQVSGTVCFKFIEQGWTIKINGIVTGFLTPDTGKLIIQSSDAFIKYAGNNYPITMNVDAQYNGAGFDGVKELSMAGTTGTLGFHADPV